MDVKKELEAMGPIREIYHATKNMVKAEHILRGDDKTFHSSGKLFKHRKENILKLQEVLESDKTH